MACLSSRTRAISTPHRGADFCLYQVSTESCVWSRSSTSTTARPRQPVNTGRSGARTLLSSSLRMQGLRERPSHILWFGVFVQSEKLLLFDTVQNELEEKIRRLEEDRHSIDITSGNRGHYVIFVHVVVTNQAPAPANDPPCAELWTDEASGRKKRRDALSPDKKRRRPSVVSDILPLLITLCFFAFTATAVSTSALLFVFCYLRASSSAVLNFAHDHISSICCLIWIFWRTGQLSERCVRVCVCLLRTKTGPFVCVWIA